MSPPKGKQPKRPGKSRLLLGIIILGCLAIAAYSFREPVGRFFSRGERADIAVLAQAIDSTYTLIQPRTLSTSTVSLGGCDVRCDLVELSRETSILRANLDITRAVEKAGGEVVYGLDSTDERRRWQTVRLGISDGDSLIREIRLKRRIR